MLNINDKLSYSGMIISFFILLSLFGPWINLNYDSYAVLNPETRLGERHYHSRIELSPFFIKVFKDNELQNQFWIVSRGLTLSGIIIFITAILCSLKYDKKWIYFGIFSIEILGLFTFFLSLGRGLSIGVLTKPGWGLNLSVLCLVILFFNAFIRMTSGTISRYNS